MSAFNTIVATLRRWFMPPKTIWDSLNGGERISEAPPPAPPAGTAGEAPILDLVLPKRQRNHIKATLGELLDGIDKTFKALTIGTSGDSCTHHETRIGLRRLGPTVIPESWLNIPPAADPNWTGGEWMPIVNPVLSEVNKIDFPSLIFIAVNEGDLTDDHWLYPDFLYATRLDRRPSYTGAVGDVIYETGAAYRTTTKRLSWQSFHVGIDKKTGVVTAGRELYRQYVPIDKHGGHGYMRTQWDVPLRSTEWGGDSHQLHRLAYMFARAFQFWRAKAAFWSVSVRKDGRRCTFAIHPKQTAVYFRDRGRTALTAGGKLRPIIHHVREHPRVLASGRETTVREHIRGLRTFNWRGYLCAVTAPKFHIWSADQFVLPGMPEEVRHKDKDYLSIKELGGDLAYMEDMQNVPTHLQKDKVYDHGNGAGEVALPLAAAPK